MSATLPARYQLLEPLGATPFSAVHRVFDTRLERTLALHWLERLDEPFLAEMGAWLRQMGQVRHPAIAQVTDFDLEHEPPYFLLELGGEPPAEVAEGDTAVLAALLEQFVPVARGLASAHERGMVHGRVHWRSVLTKQSQLENETPPLFITDLGLPGWMPATEEVPEQLWPYLAPEQWRGDTAVAASDVYSLGIMLYKLIVGQYPFRGEQVGQWAGLHLNRQAPPAHTVRPAVPLELSALLADLLSKEPAGRPTMRELGDRLSVLAGQVAQAPLADSEDSLQIVVTYNDVASGGTQRDLFTLPATVELWYIGAAVDCEVRLMGRAVLPQHVRVHREAGRWLVEDLGSEQGTFLQGQKLVAGRPEVWLAGDSLQMGGYQIRWSHNWSAADTAVLRAPTTAVQVQLNPTQQTVTPGERAFFEIELLNQGIAVNHCVLQITGVPSHWVTLSGQMLQLLPQARATVQLTLAPPRTHAALAQTYPFQLLLAVTGHKAAHEATAGTLTVRPFVALRSDIQSQQLVNDGVCYLTIYNEGNATAHLSTTGRDGAGTLIYEDLPTGVPLAAGGSQTFAVGVQNPTRPWLGSSKVMPFTLTSTLALPSDPAQQAVQTNMGRLEAKPRLSRVLLTAVFGTLILFCIMSFLISTSYTSNRQAVTATVQAVNTERALEATLTAAARAIEEAQTPRPTDPPTLTPIPVHTLTPTGE